MKIAGIEFTKVEDGEYNEARTKIQDHAVTIFSDREGDEWLYSIDDGEFFGGYSSPVEAVRAAVAEVKEL